MAPTGRTSRLQKVIGENVTSLRNAARISQEKLAETCGYDRSYLSSIENGKRNITIAVLVALGDALGVDPIELLRRRS
jgi:transcriptional regulator with XRE-family HTH domain